MGTRFHLALVALITSAAATNTWAAVGRTVGQFDVSRTGAATYAIPIWAPPGPRGIQPNLSLLYDSRSGIGPLGIGWSIAGLGEITRCNKTVAQDTTAAPVALVVGDGYCINGNRLRLTSGTYGTAGSVYQTEIADFSQITANGAAGNGPAYFTVKGRNGLTYYYGYTDANGNGANSQVIANGSTTALTWLLSKVTDRAGNNYVINYTTLSGTLIGTAVPSNIHWTSTGGTSYAYTMQFNYTANVSQSSINKYVAGTNVSNPQMLSSIEVLYNSTVVKDYFLSYSASPTTGREQIASITECSTNTPPPSANCLSPTSITYGHPTAGLSTTVNTALSSSGTGLTARYDLNGDGYPDLVYNNGTNWYVSFGSASGYGTPVSTGIGASATVLPGNLNAGLADGLLANNGGTWYYYTWNGTSFAGVSTGLAYDSTAFQYQLADIDGDGLPDLIYLYFSSGTATVKTRLNTTTGSTVSFSSTLSTGYSTNVLGAQLQTPDTQYSAPRHYDFDGDGRDDIVLTVERSSPHGGTVVSTYELLSRGTIFTASLIEGGAYQNYQTVYFANWNDDKCTDYVFANTVYISGCDGSVPKTYAISGTVVAALDWDGDGRTDVVIANGSTLGVYLSTGSGISASVTTTTLPYTSTCQYVTMNAAGGSMDDLGCWSQSGSKPITYYLHNGVPDLVTKFQDGYGNSASPSYTSIAQGNYTQYSDATPGYADYIGPLNVVSEVVFSDPSTQSGTYNQSFWYYGAWVNLQGRGFQSFNAKRMIDSRNGLYYFQYFERAFPETGMDFEDDLTNNNGAHFTTTIRTPAVVTLPNGSTNQGYFAYFSNITTSQRELPPSDNGALITTTSTDYTFDNYGNALTINRIVTDNDPNSPYTLNTWTTNTTNTTDISTNQGNDLAAWCLNMLVKTQVVYSSSLAGSTSVTRTKQFGLDTPTECRVKTIVTEPTANSGLYRVDESLTFDSFGNVATDTVTGANMPSSPASRLTTLNWGTTGQFLNSIMVPIGTVANPANATTTWTYTSNQALTFGVPDSVIDANNLTTSWLYDSFGRKNKETRPDSTSTTWTWSTCSSNCGWSNSVYQIAQTAFQTNGTTAIRTDTTSYDPIDRVSQAAGPTVTGGIATVQTLYNSMGLVAQLSMPFLSGTPYQQSYNYDVLNRLIESERPVNASSGKTYCDPTVVPPVSGCQGVAYTYAGRTSTVTDARGYTQTAIYDVNGWLRQTKDALGYTVRMAYDSYGSVIGISDTAGNTLLSNVTYKYGIKAFRVAATDTDLGAWTYTIDSLGEPIGWMDANGQSFLMTYDALSRPVTRTDPITSTDPGLFTQWQWGSTPASHNVSQLINECTTTGNPTSCGATPQYTETRAFDTLGRLYTRSITQSGNTGGNDGGGAFLFTSNYSPTTGFLDTLKYPISTSGSALTLQYRYGSGLLSSVTDTTDTAGTCGSTCTLWTANTMNGFGQITKETLGNGVVTNRTYDAVTSWLSAATAGVGGGAALLNQSYLEDKNGNVIQRQQNNSPGITESFSYDADNRLTCTALSSTCTTPTLAYDGPGNITSQSGVGTYNYNVPGTYRQHAVVSIVGTLNGITNPTFSYDANGNMTGRASSSQNIYWFSYNYPQSISGSDVTGNEEVQFNYGPDRQRWKQVYTGPSGIETTYYIGGLIDLVFSGGTTDYRHYIYAGSEPVAVYSRTAAGVNTMSYMLEDHQGGVSAVASKSGAADVNESFSVFGTRRNPATWSGAPSATDLNAIAGLSRQGYTFQTWLGQSMGLNHMNGRVQDAITGRFLSPDRNVPDPGNTQSYNRYSYVNNNPLTFIDPTGFVDCGGEMGWCGTDMGGGSPGDDGGGETVDPGSNTAPPDQQAPQPVPCGADCMALQQTVISTPINDQPVAPVPQPLPYFPDFGSPFSPLIFPPSRPNQAQSTKPTPCPTKSSGSYLSNVIQNDTDTNVALPGLLAPTGMGIFTAGATSEAWLGTSAATLGRWAFSGFSAIRVGPAVFSTFESGVLVASSSALNFAFTGLSFEAGTLGGSMISAIPTGSGNTVRGSLTNFLYNNFGPQSNAAELKCGW